MFLVGLDGWWDLKPLLNPNESNPPRGELRKSLGAFGMLRLERATLAAASLSNRSSRVWFAEECVL